jgi:cell division septum initiation protein DivIVA
MRQGEDAEAWRTAERGLMATNEIFAQAAEEIARLGVKLARETERLENLAAEKRALDTQVKAMTANLAEIHKRHGEEQKGIEAINARAGEARGEAERIVAEAQTRAGEILADANREAKRIVASATAKAQQALKALA